jgi:hypothetical protein
MDVNAYVVIRNTETLRAYREWSRANLAAGQPFQMAGTLLPCFSTPFILLWPHSPNPVAHLKAKLFAAFSFAMISGALLGLGFWRMARHCKANPWIDKGEIEFRARLGLPPRSRPSRPLRLRMRKPLEI